jgi:hypothetical protein
MFDGCQFHMLPGPVTMAMEDARAIFESPCDQAEFTSEMDRIIKTLISGMEPFQYLFSIDPEHHDTTVYRQVFFFLTHMKSKFGDSQIRNLAHTPSKRGSSGTRKRRKTLNAKIADLQP